KSTVINKSALTTHNIQKGNYQKFKSDFTNINLSKTNDFSHIGRGRSDNKLMLYVAGGIALGTTSLVLINKPGNSAMENPQQANTGVIIGGVIATGMIITKYFLDKNRR
ncbi:MAG: hypothetical protein U9R54_09585, partial [Bacteroidota bacterium]|nr:hypothetical protein [Bacteroidota bacterium]